MIRLPLLLACWMAFALPVAASPTSDDELIVQLGSSDFTLREAAHKALAQRGENALTTMRAANNSTDPEVRKRLTELIARAERTSLLTPKLVSLHVQNVAVKKVLEELAKQTGYKLGCQPDEKSLVTLNVDHLPFWQTIDLICQQTGLGLQSHYDNTNTLMFFRVGRFTPHVSYCGPFRISAGSFHHSKTLDLNAASQVTFTPRMGMTLGNSRTESLMFAFHVIGEPKVPLMGLGQPKLLAAIDDQGNNLMPPEVRNYDSHYHNYYYGYRNPLLQSQVQLHGPGNARSLRIIRGSLPVTFLADQQPEITIDKIMSVKDQKFESKDVTFEISEVKESNKQVQIRANIRRNTSDNAQDYTWTNSLGQRVELVDDAGLKFQCDGFNWENGTPTSAAGTFQFSDGGDTKLGKPAKLIYYSWVMSLHQLEFQFADLPLP